MVHGAPVDISVKWIRSAGDQSDILISYGTSCYDFPRIRKSIRKKYETNLQSNEDAVKFCLLLSSVCLAHDRQNELRFILINSFLVKLPYKIHVYKKT